MIPTDDPADDQHPEPELDTEYYAPEPEEEPDEEAYRQWAAEQPLGEVAHACGHTRTYVDVWGLPLVYVATPCYDCQPWDDPFGEG